MQLRVGDIVEIKSKEEILQTLDGDGRCDGLPFMPQMFEFCGKQYKVYKSAHKTCDTVTKTGGRRLRNSVHLELRCDGQAYDGCQQACLIFWKTVWLSKVTGSPTSCKSHFSSASVRESRAACTEAVVWRATRSTHQAVGAEPVYVCQATLLPNYTSLLRWWDVSQYLDDWKSGNVPLMAIATGIGYSLVQRIARVHWRLKKPLSKVYDTIQSLLGGVPYPEKVGTIPKGSHTPTATLDLQPGEWVRVKSYDEILYTLDDYNNNRGMRFDPELVPYCGGVYKVRSRIERFIDEKTGKMRSMKTPAVILEGVWCQSRYSARRIGCPRSIYSWWREIWLERITEQTDANSVSSPIG